VLGWLVKQQQEVDVTSPLTRRSRGSGKRGEGDWTRGFLAQGRTPKLTGAENTTKYLQAGQLPSFELGPNSQYPCARAV
jgi:hypothetical protein